MVQLNDGRLWLREGEVVHPFTVQHSSRRLLIQVLNQAPAVHAQPFFVLKRGEHQLAIKVLDEGPLPGVCCSHLGIEIVTTLAMCLQFSLE